LATVERSGEPGPQLRLDLGVSKQAVSQAVEVLVSRGYLERRANSEDRRRVRLDLTVDGRRVLESVIRATDAVDQELVDRISVERVEALRAGLIALAEMKGAGSEGETPLPRRRQRLLRNFSPILPVRDLDAALEHYASLGFHTLPYDDGGYGFANRDGQSIHLCHEPDHSPEHGDAAYLYVRDADALYEEWSRPGIGGVTRPVEVMPYEMREGSHLDPDGNLIRFGSPIDEPN
jgi:DNA-binding MarR family transcriptional regulator/catechol 2,3-dioxygenase-like lactoylglutathione lyase family enzyme